MKTTINRLYIIVGLSLILFYVYIYNYMYFCEWSFKNNTDNNNDDVESIEHLVMLGDPQMEGDWRIKTQGKQGQYNIWFNDNYFRHIINNIAYYLKPSFVFVLGDLFSSQHCNDVEFQRRVDRYNRIFSPLDRDVKLYNITGNHDIGYADGATPERIQRFEAAFGPVNDQVMISGHLFGIVNSISLAKSKYEQPYNDSWNHLRELKALKEESNLPLIIVTHIPLYKQYNIDPLIEEGQQQQQQQQQQEGISPKEDTDNEEDLNPRGKRRKNTNNMNNEKIIFPNDHPKYKTMCTETYFSIEHRQGWVKEQSMLSKEVSDYILDELRPIFIFNGHDHDGCLYKHNNQTMEYTIRSMMGDHSGYSGLFEIKKFRNQSYEYSFKACPFIHTMYINISFGVTAGYIISFIFYQILLFLIGKLQKKKPKVKFD